MKVIETPKELNKDEGPGKEEIEKVEEQEKQATEESKSLSETEEESSSSEEEKKDKKKGKKDKKKGKKSKDKKKGTEKKDKKGKNKAKEADNIFEVSLVQAYMKGAIQKIIEHLVETKPGVSITMELNGSEKPSSYLRDLFQIMREMLESKQVDENRKSEFIEKYRNKIFESGIFLDDKQMDKKYFVVNYEEPEPVPKVKKFNTFYRVDDVMGDSEEEHQQDQGQTPPEDDNQEEMLVVDNLQEVSPKAQEEMGKKIAEVIRDDVQIVKEIQYQKPN